MKTMARHSFQMTVLCALLMTLGACTAVGPTYQRPATTIPVHFKEAEGWVAAKPADGLERDAWWTLFADAELNALASRVSV